MSDGDSKPLVSGGELADDAESGEAANAADVRALEERLAGIGPVDIVFGINTKNTQTTIVHVMNVVCEGLQRHFPAMKCLVVVSDGFSDDETLVLAEFFPTPRGIKKFVTTQLGGPGKGNGVRTIMEVARITDAHACAFVDGDLVSIRPIWVDNMLRPILHGLTDLVVPYYLRDKWDGVITNHLCYPLTSALYGSSVRQPIGGDYGMSRAYYNYVLKQGDVPPHFGIDIYLATTAIAEGFRIQEAPLGIKIHASTTEYTDPRKTLSRMYLEVVGSLLDLAKKYEGKWRVSNYQPPVLLSENVVSYYDRLPPPTQANEASIKSIFVEGVDRYDDALQRVLSQEMYKKLQSSRAKGIEADDWPRMVYAIAAWYVTDHDHVEKEDLLHALGALGMGRFLRFVDETRNSDLQESYGLIQEYAHTFQRRRDEFITRVDRLRHERHNPQVAAASRAHGDGRRR